MANTSYCKTYLKHIFFITTLIFSGLTCTAAEIWFQLADIQFFSKATFYTYKTCLILPSVEKLYLKSLDESIQNVIARGKLNLFICIANALS